METLTEKKIQERSTLVEKVTRIANGVPWQRFTQAEAETILSALEENKRLQEALENVKETIENCPEEEAVELLRFLFQLRKTVVKALTGK